MAYTGDEDELEKRNKGRLDEREHDELGLVGPRARAAQVVFLRTTALLIGRSTAPLAKAQKIAARLGAVLAGNSSKALVSTFHMRHSFVSRDPSPTPEPSACRRGKAVAIYPHTKRFVKLAKKVGKFDQESRTYVVPVGHRFLRTRKARQLRSEAAKALRQMWLAGRSAGHSKITATEFQAYVSRVGLSDEDRKMALDADEKGFIDFGSIGRTHDECNAFWRAVDSYETQERARLQSRAEFELPYGVPSSCRREIVEKLGEFLIGEGLQFWAAVHRPGRLSDPRSSHLHLEYHNRQVVANSVEFEPQADGTVRVVRGDPIFSPKKDRSHQGEAWLNRLREVYADIVNYVLAREAVRTHQLPPFFYFPGTYQDLGIDAPPQEHMGARRTAIERRGGSTRRGDKNDDILEDRVTKRIDEAIDKIEINLKRLGAKKRSTPDSQAHDKAGNDLETEIHRIRGLCERAIGGLTYIETALSELPTPESNDLFIAAIREYGFFAFDLCRPRYEGLAVEAPAQDDLSPLPGLAQDDASQRGRLAAIARLFFLHQLEIAALTLQTHVVRRRSSAIPMASGFSTSIALSEQMRAPLPTVRIVADVAKNPRTFDRQMLDASHKDYPELLRLGVQFHPNSGHPWHTPRLGVERCKAVLKRWPRMADLEFVSWLDVSDDWQATATMLGAVRSPLLHEWYAPSHLWPIDRQKLIKFFGSIESKIAHRVAVERRSEELVSRQTPDPQVQVSKPIASETPASKATGMHSAAVTAAALPQSRPLAQPAGAPSANRRISAAPQSAPRPVPRTHDSTTAPTTPIAPLPARSQSSTAAASSSASQRAGTPLAGPQKGNTNPPSRALFPSAPAIAPRAAERPVLRPAPIPGMANPAARTPTPPAQRPPVREDLTLHLPTASYDYGVATSDPETRRTYEARARKFTEFELYVAFELTRKMADTLAGLPFNSPDRRGYASQGDYASGLRLLDEEYVRRNLFFADLQKRFRIDSPTKPAPKPTEAKVPASPSAAGRRTAHRSRDERER